MQGIGSLKKLIRKATGRVTKDHERAILLTVHQYEPTEIKPHLHSTNFEEVSAVMREALGKGVECWNVDLKFTPKGVKLLGVTNTTEDLLKY